MLPKKRRSVTLENLYGDVFSCVIDCVVGNVPSLFFLFCLVFGYSPLTVLYLVVVLRL